MERDHRIAVSDATHRNVQAAQYVTGVFDDSIEVESSCSLPGARNSLEQNMFPRTPESERPTSCSPMRLPVSCMSDSLNRRSEA
jgi:hypothetical protein